MKSVRPESMYVARRSKAGNIRLRLHIVLRRELNPSLAVKNRRTRFYWRRCRQRLLSLYERLHPYSVKVAPVFALERLPRYEVTMNRVKTWNKAVAESGSSVLGIPRT